MLNFKKLYACLAVLCLQSQSFSQVFPNSTQYKIAQEFFSNNPQKLAKLVSSINTDTYGKCLKNVTQWDIGMMNKQADPDNNTKLSLAAQWVGLAEARKKLMSQGISDSQLNASVKSYTSRNDVGNGNVNFIKCSTDCYNIAQNAINN